jgi:hypothetical protein
MTAGLGLLIEALIAGLLVVTIIYCSRLNARLVNLRAGEEALRATIGELVSATEGAQRAIAELRETAETSQRTLGERLSRAEEVAVGISEQIKAGEELLVQATRIARLRFDPPTPPVNPGLGRAAATAAAAERFASKARGGL